MLFSILSFAQSVSRCKNYESIDNTVLSKIKETNKTKEINMI